MQIRDRVKEFRRVKASELRPHPLNWRVHPTGQQDALRGLLAEIGFAGALLVRELPDGALQLIDGHLRAETLPESLLPVLVLDVDQREAATLLALVDPLSALARPEPQHLGSLLAEVTSDHAAIQQILKQLQDECATPVLPDEHPGQAPRIGESFQIVVDCADEPAQRQLYERLIREGYQCRVLTL